MTTLAVVNIPSLTNLPADAVTNQWAIEDDGAATDTQLETITGAVADFYRTVDPVSAKSVASYISGQMSRAANVCTVKMYDITGHESGTPHGSPRLTRSFTLPAAGGGSHMPSEVACVLRLEAEGRALAQVETADTGDAGPELDRPKQRRTGRVFIGPLTSNSVFVVANIPRVDPGLIDTLLGRGVALDTAIKAVSPNFKLGVWSRKDAIVRPLESFAVDNAFDTQRRRGEKASALTRRAI